MFSYLRFAIFLSVVLLSLIGMAVFVQRRTRTAWVPPSWVSRALLGAAVGGVLLMMSGRFVGDGTYSQFAGAVGGTLTVATIITFVLMFAAYLVERSAALIARLLGVGRAIPSSDEERVDVDRQDADEESITQAKEGTKPDVEETPPLLEGIDGHAIFGRRGFLAKAGTGAALTVGTGSSMYAGIFGRHDYVIEEVPIKLAKLSPSLDGFTIVQLSDVHLGTFVGEREIRAALALVAKAKPDVIVLTGDLLDHNAAFGRLLGEMTRKLVALAPVYAIPGNHDYYAGLEAAFANLRAGGAQVLMNQGQTIAEGKIAMLGVDDVWARRQNRGHGPDVHSALATVPQDLPRVLLCHNPVYFPEASPHVDLQLSGHTHGGQINLGVRPADLLLPFGYVAGHYRRDGAQLWVNRGFGTVGPPARLQAAPEVTKIILTV